MGLDLVLQALPAGCPLLERSRTDPEVAELLPFLPRALLRVSEGQPWRPWPPPPGPLLRCGHPAPHRLHAWVTPSSDLNDFATWRSDGVVSRLEDGSGTEDGESDSDPPPLPKTQIL